MKKLLLFLLVIPIFCRAQDTLRVPKMPIDSATGGYSYVDITQVPGKTKDDLYVKINEWVALNFKSANNVIQMNDKEAGKIIVKGVTERTLMYKMLGKNYIPYYLNFTINFTVKDGRYRVIIDGFSAKNKTDNSKIYDTDITPKLAQTIIQYNSKKHHYDDDDDGFLSFKKYGIQFQSQYLDHADEFARETIQEIKTALLKPSKDEF